MEWSSAHHIAFIDRIADGMHACSDHINTHTYIIHVIQDLPFFHDRTIEYMEYALFERTYTN